MDLFLVLLGCFALASLLLYIRLRERRYLKKKTSEAMSETVWKEIVEEREEALKKRRHFQEALKQAAQKSEEHSQPK